MSRAIPPQLGIRSRPPPAPLMRHVVNPAVRMIIRSPLARWTGNLTLLIFTTRRTGRRLPVLAHKLGPALVVFTDRGWAANFRETRPVILICHGHRRHGHAVLSDDPAETAAALRAVLQQPTNPRRLGFKMHPAYRPTDTELANLRRMIRIPR